MRVRKTMLLFGVALACAGVAQALPLDVPDFAVDPSGPAFTIQAIPPGQGATFNTIGPPELFYGVTDPETGTPNTMQMNWQPDDPTLPAQAGWELVFGLDPDLTNQTITLSIHPPNVNPPPPAPAGGITHMEVHLIDVNQLSVGGWGFNTDQSSSSPPGWIPLANDPVPWGKAPVFPLPWPPGPNAPPPPPPPGQVASLAQCFMQTVTINVGNGPAPGSAIVNGGPMGPLIGPNYLIAGAGGDLTKITTMEFYENGVLAGNASVPLGQQPGLNNYWDHISVTPEPATIGLLGLGALALIRRRKR